MKKTLFTLFFITLVAIFVVMGLADVEPQKMFNIYTLEAIDSTRGVGAAEVTKVSTVAEPGKSEITEITTIDERSNSEVGRYFTINDASDIGFYVWDNVDSLSSDPHVSGFSGIEVMTLSTDNSTSVATKIKNKLNTTSWFSASSSSSVLTITNKKVGAATNANVKTSGFSKSVTQEGADSIYCGKYFTINTASDAELHYFYFNNTSSETCPDPILSGKTGHKVDIVAADTANSIASKINTAFGLVSGFSASASSNVVTVTNSSNGHTSNASKGTSPLNIGISTDGKDAGYVIGQEQNSIFRTKVAAYAYTTSAITGAVAIKLQISPVDSGDVWFDTGSTITPSSSLNGLTYLAPVSISARRYRLYSPSAISGGSAIIYTVVSN